MESENLNGFICIFYVTEEKWDSYLQALFLATVEVKIHNLWIQNLSAIFEDGKYFSIWI